MFIISYILTQGRSNRAKCKQTKLCLPGKPCLISDHDIIFFPLKQEWKLIDHSLDDVFNMWTLRLELCNVWELQCVKQSWPPADGQVFAVHRVQFAVFSHPSEGERMTKSSNSWIYDLYNLKRHLQHFFAKCCLVRNYFMSGS